MVTTALWAALLSAEVWFDYTIHFHSDVGSTSSFLVLGTGMGCLKKLWMPHDRTCWMGFWATWSSRSVSAHGTGVGARWSLNVPSNPNTLWFHNPSNRDCQCDSNQVNGSFIGRNPTWRFYGYTALYIYTASGIARNCEDRCQVPINFFGIWPSSILHIWKEHL